MDVLSLMDVESVQVWMQAGGYVLLFALLFACGLGFPLPEDIPLLLAGFAVAHGRMNIVIAAVVAWCGIIGGDCVLYSIARKYGMQITRLPLIGRHVTEERIERAERLFERWGILVVGVARMFAGIRGAMVVAAGTIRYSFVKFVIADGVAAIVSGGLFVYLGWLGGKTLGTPRQVVERIAPYKMWVTIGIVAAVALLVLYIWWRRKRHMTISEVLVEKAEHAAEKRTVHVGSGSDLP